MTSQIFNIQALLPAGATEKQIPSMLQALLRERFKLVATKTYETRDAHVLQVGKDGPKVKAVADPRSTTMPQLAALLGLMLALPGPVDSDQAGDPGGDFAEALNVAGLRLVKMNVPVSAVTILSAERVPAEN